MREHSGDSVMPDNRMDELELLTIPEAARFCGVARNTVNAWVRQGKLSAYKTPGKTSLIRPTDLVKFMQKSGLFVPPGLIDRARLDATMGAVESSAEGGEATRSVLVVDDDILVRGMVVQAIDELYPVAQSRTGYEALHLLTFRKDIKVVLLDIRMPGQKGTDTFSEIRRLRDDVEVIIVTGYIEDVPDGIMADPRVRGILEKPVDEETLVNMVRDAMHAAW